jgi:hypothetical protein
MLVFGLDNEDRAGDLRIVSTSDTQLLSCYWPLDIESVDGAQHSTQSLDVTTGETADKTGWFSGGSFLGRHVGVFVEGLGSRDVQFGVRENVLRKSLNVGRKTEIAERRRNYL